MRACEGGEEDTLGQGNKGCKDSGAGTGSRLELTVQGAEWRQVMSGFKSQERSVPHAKCHGKQGLITGVGMVSDCDVGDSGGKKVRLCINPGKQ